MTNPPSHGQIARPVPGIPDPLVLPFFAQYLYGLGP